MSIFSSAISWFSIWHLYQPNW